MIPAYFIYVKNECIDCVVLLQLYNPHYRYTWETFKSANFLVCPWPHVRRYSITCFKNPANFGWVLRSKWYFNMMDMNWSSMMYRVVVGNGCFCWFSFIRKVTFLCADRLFQCVIILKVFFDGVNKYLVMALS